VFFPVKKFRRQKNAFLHLCNLDTTL